MKKLLLFTISILILISCKKDDLLIQEKQVTESQRFFGVAKLKDTDSTSLKGVAQKDKLWHNGTTISVKFLNGTTTFKNKVKLYASEWEKYANIKFDFIEHGNAHVRITFDSESKSITWSYTGTDCKYIRNQNEATLNFAELEYLKEADIKGDVLRAFGQVLGLELEHRHLKFEPGWKNINSIKRYWQNKVEDIPWEELKKYVLDPIENKNIIFTENYDINSIMIWPFMSRLAENTPRDFNRELSANDIEFIKKLYPKGLTYRTGYEHELSEPDWDKLKTINGIIGTNRDLEGNYYFYPYYNGQIKKYSSNLINSEVIGTSNQDFRMSPIIMPYNGKNILLRRNYNNNNHMYYLELGKVSSEIPILVEESSRFGSLHYDWDRGYLYHKRIIFNNSLQKISSFIAFTSSTYQSILYWGKKYKWAVHVDGNNDPTFYVYQQSDSRDLVSKSNLITTITVKNFIMSNGAYTKVYEYNNKLIIVRFGGSGGNGGYGSILILDPEGTKIPSKQKIYAHQDAKWRQSYSPFYLCGGIHWKHKLMLYDEHYNKYYFEFDELRD